MNPTTNEPQHNFFLLIPAFVADDPDLDDSTKLLFGRLTALSNQKGYCWASDKYIADLCGCKDRVISDRLKVLEDKGYIIRETEKNGMVWNRKIIPVYSVFKKNITNNIIKQQQAAAPDAAVFSSKDNNKISTQNQQVPM